MFGIMTHGIPISDFPVRNDGSVDRESHNTLIETRKELESEPWTKTKAIVPMSTDVLLGRGRGVQYHEGNVGLRVVMERYLAEYDQSQRKDRKEVASKVVDEVQRKGGRFLQKANSAWQEVNDKQVATKKVMHGFRDMRKLKSHSFESLEQDSSKDEDATRKRPLDVFSC